MTIKIQLQMLSQMFPTMRGISALTPWPPINASLARWCCLP